MRIKLMFLLVLPLLLLPSSHTRAYPIPDTGQTDSYTDTFGEDSDYLINPPSYTKLDANGNDLPDSAASWVMVRDNVTGLIWEAKTDDGSVHDKDNTYTWYDSNPATNGGNSGTPGDGTDTEDFINALNAENFGGYLDWRLPTIKELASIVDYGTIDPAIVLSYFPYTVSSYYWSSTTWANYSDRAWHVNFLNGEGFDDNWSNKSGLLHVRAVRGELTATTDHLVLNGEGTVSDTLTGLMWQQGEVENEMNRDAAISYCETLTLGGYSDWRLPNQNELRSIVDYSVEGPAIAVDIFMDALPVYYWSSTTAVHAGAWYIQFSSGRVSDTYKSNEYHVRAVRGGQPQLVGHLLISSPAQASIWNTGSIMPIQWNTAGISGNVSIFISTQGGKDGTFQTIIDNTPNNGSYDWTVNVASSVNCVLKMEPVSDTTKGTSQGLFSVESSVSLPPTAAAEAATGITAASATLAGTVNPNGESTTVVFEWGTDTGYGNETAAVQGSLTGTTAQSVTADLTGLSSGQTYHYRVSATNSAGTTSGDDMTFTTPNKETVRKAIIVAGSGPYDTNDLWEATLKCAIGAYAALKDQGYTPKNIYFMSAGSETDVDGDGVVDVDNGATNQNLEYALKTWAPGADNLFVYLVGHGHYGEFEMGEWEMLLATDFDAWLDSAQASIPDFVAIVYDACRAGSFLSDLIPPAGKTRVFAASAGPNENAIFMVDGSLSFGWHFFTELRNGASFKESFTRGRESVLKAYDSDQNPRIEADWDVNGVEKKDLEIAAGIKVGLEKVIAGGIPRIQSASPHQTLPEGVSEASVYATQVEGEGIAEVFAVIKPPDYVSGSPDDPVVDLPKIQLPPLGNRYQGTYDGFTSTGTYNIAIFAKNEKGYLSLPVQTTVTVGDKACLAVGAGLSIQVPCVDYNGNLYGFTLDFYRHPDDPSGYYWKLVMATLTAGTGPECISVGADLSIPMSCVTYNGRQYGFTLRRYNNPYDSTGLYWMMDVSTLVVK